MRRRILAVAVVFFMLGVAVSAYADLDGFIGRLNAQAEADTGGFHAKLSAQFGLPLPQVKAVIKAVDTPADAFICLQLGHMTGRSPEEVLDVYKGNRGKGWGVIAEDLGIKPGSPEFHALKRGNFSLTGKPMGKGKQMSGKAKGKGPKK